jgi:hypothetical protein
MHAAEPSLGWYVPFAQIVHAVDAGLLYFPTLQRSHAFLASSVVVSKLLTVKPMVPAGQALQ